MIAEADQLSMRPAASFNEMVIISPPGNYQESDNWSELLRFRNRVGILALLDKLISALVMFETRFRWSESNLYCRNISRRDVVTHPRIFLSFFCARIPINPGDVCLLFAKSFIVFESCIVGVYGRVI